MSSQFTLQGFASLMKTST